MRALYSSLSLLFVLFFAFACSSKASTPSTTTTPGATPSAATTGAAPSAAATAPSTLTICVSLANVRSGPGTTYTVTKQLSQGTVITPTTKSGEWYYLGKDDSQNDSYIHESVVCSATDSSGTPNSTSVSSSCPTGCTEQPAGCEIKGNISYKTGEKVYYMPGDPDYDKTVIDPDYGERWFCTEAEAQTNGWKRVAH